MNYVFESTRTVDCGDKKETVNQGDPWGDKHLSYADAQRVEVWHSIPGCYSIAFSKVHRFWVYAYM